MTEFSGIADMHTHSENSHDSECPMEEMLLAHLSKNCPIMAVTDHFDTWFFDDYDIFTPIKTAAEEADRLNEKYKGKALILKGLEISEGFWYPEVAKKVYTLADYDVVIGSIHTVREENRRMPYSWEDFEPFDREKLTCFMEAYLRDVKFLAEHEDFDILAHLTCPLRYINGKFKKNFSLKPFENEIEEILKIIIERNIALEINTSSYGVLGDFMPSRDIIKRYKELGGRLITLGSDAHISDNACTHFEEALSTVKELGFEGIYYFKNRKPVMIRI